MRLACVQCDVAFGDPILNAERAIAELRELKARGVELALFPEAYLTGYCVDTAGAAAEIAISRSHVAIQTLNDACEELDILAVVGFAEADGGCIYNTAALLEPGKAPRFYQKTHLPDLGIDKFVEPGKALTVFETRLGRIGVLICFDLRPPEATRVLALAGAELILLPTNWPEGAETSANHIAIARAAENKVFVATCNRVGTENGFRFIGLSKIIDVTGKLVATAAQEQETILGDINLDESRRKRSITIPGKYEIEIFASRNPALYGRIMEG